MDKIKKLIIICIICIIVIIVIIGALVLLQHKKVEEETTDELGNYMEDHEEDYKTDTTIKKVDDKTKYYIIKNIVNQYFEYVNMIKENPSTELEEEESNLSKTLLMNIYSKSYINEFNITESNLTKKIEKYINCEYNIDSIYILEKSLPINMYLINISIQGEKEQFNLIIVTDSSISAFEIYGDEFVKKYKYNDENMDKLVDFEADELVQNEYNKITSIRVENQDVAMDYFNNYKYNMLNNPEKAYDLLEKEYREKRFGDVKQYKKYIEENKDEFEEIIPTQYLVNNYENYTEYVCKDKYENLYIFKETAIMDYTVQLDTYTITTDKFKEEYSKANDNKKVIMNIDKFIQMINNYDYKAAYEVLNMSFKEKYFKTEEEFKKYMQNNYYRYNDISLEKFSDENGTYVYNTTIQNKLNKEEQKEMNIIMKLNNDTYFEMSFEVIENRR